MYSPLTENYISLRRIKFIKVFTFIEYRKSEVRITEEPNITSECDKCNWCRYNYSEEILVMCIKIRFHKKLTVYILNISWLEKTVTNFLMFIV